MSVILTTFSLFIFLSITDVDSQRLPPGVPPQHYQQQVPHPQYQQQQFQQPMHQQVQQPQFQHQQHVPVQQQQQHVPIQQQQQHIPVQQGHAHTHAHPQSNQILNAANIAQEKEHIAEHLDIPMDTGKMTEQELQFHYFKMHDADNNNKLDGCELIKSLIHWHEQGNVEGQANAKVENKVFKDEELVTLIDPILKMDDTNQDGYIDYLEFIQAQQKAAATSTPPK